MMNNIFYKLMVLIFDSAVTFFTFMGILYIMPIDYFGLSMILASIVSCLILTDWEEYEESEENITKE